jgi:enamine deaminase RidA (YjgF/YER057c/UK114 family)
MREYAAMNEVWDAWIPEGTAPVRACVEARLANPGYRVEMVVTAARKNIA